MCVHAFRESKEREGGKRERECVCVSNLVFYAQSTSTVISERDGERQTDRQTDKVTWCFTPSQPVRLYQRETETDRQTKQLGVLRPVNQYSYFTHREGGRREKERERERETQRERERKRDRERQRQRERESLCAICI